MLFRAVLHSAVSTRPDLKEPVSPEFIPHRMRYSWTRHSTRLRLLLILPSPGFLKPTRFPVSALGGLIPVISMASGTFHSLSRTIHLVVLMGSWVRLPTNSSITQVEKLATMLHEKSISVGPTVSIRAPPDFFDANSTLYSTAFSSDSSHPEAFVYSRANQLAQASQASTWALWEGKG